MEQAGDLVDKQIGVGGHGLQAGHGGLVALVRLPDQLEHREAPAGVADAHVPGQVQAVEAGDAAGVDAQIDEIAVLVGGEALAGGDPVVTGLGVVGDREVLGDERMPGQGDVAADSANAGRVDRLFRREAVIDQQDQAGAAVEALQFDDLGEGLVELGGLQVFLEALDGVVAARVGAAEGDGDAMAQDLVRDGVDVAARDPVGVERFELGFGQ